MKFTETTRKILNNYSTINPSILFKKGDTIATKTPTSTVISLAKLDQKIEHDFGIFDITKFLNTLSLFTDYTLDFKDKYLVISEGRTKINYTYASEDILKETLKNLPTEAQAKKQKENKFDIEFDLTEAQLNQTTKALSILSLKNIGIIGRKKKIFLSALDPKNPSGDIYEVEVGETENDFQIIFNPDNMKLIPMNYKVRIIKPSDKSPYPVCNFEGENINYWLSYEAESVFT